MGGLDMADPAGLWLLRLCFCCWGNAALRASYPPWAGGLAGVCVYDRGTRVCAGHMKPLRTRLIGTSTTGQRLRREQSQVKEQESAPIHDPATASWGWH